MTDYDHPGHGCSSPPKPPKPVHVSQVFLGFVAYRFEVRSSRCVGGLAQYGSPPAASKHKGHEV